MTTAKRLRKLRKGIGDGLPLTRQFVDDLLETDEIDIESLAMSTVFAIGLLEIRIQGLEAEVESRVEDLDGRVNGVEESDLEGRIQGVETDIESRIDMVEVVLESRIDMVEMDLGQVSDIDGRGSDLESAR